MSRWNPQPPAVRFWPKVDDHRGRGGSMTPDEEDRFINRLHERIDSVMEACWYAGRRNHPAPNVSKSYGAERGDILRMVRAALKRAKAED